MLVVGLKNHRQGFASCHALIYHKNHTGLAFQPKYLYSPTVRKPTLKTENRKRVYQLLLIHPLFFAAAVASALSGGRCICLERLSFAFTEASTVADSRYA